ncbi:topology modulation protein [Streptomyces sp. SID3343]|uniref:topology modulation protein n=1 Tax=Streptomyces sp. SID3343 TaxID=2690260 RepID=UPI001367E367|nr:topology modulation protein [Streptomyces sp. SID3343]MYW04615.1 topology modulation protein [Streptomyces sp. SID3343]
MRKVLVVGVSGAGKTVLAHELGERLGLPVTHLDGLYYRDDWSVLPAEEFAEAQREIVARPSWIIDGNHAATLDIRLAAADTVVFLDINAPAALLGILARRRRYRGGQHPEDGVYDRLGPSVVRYVLAYRHTMRPRVRRLIDEHAAPDAALHTFTTRGAADRWVASLPTS